MKKIIELIEKALDTMQLPGFEHTQETCDAFTKVAEALVERKTLEHTPITEDWLKANGWEIHEGLRGIIPAPYANRHIGKNSLEYNICRKSLRVLFYEYVEGNVTYSDFYCENIDSVAKILDACSLCGINLED